MEDAAAWMIAMPPNKPVKPETLAAIAKLKADLREDACRARADRKAHAASEGGRKEAVEKLRAMRRQTVPMSH